MALKLYPAFLEAGLPAPSMDASVGIMGWQDPYLEPLSTFFVESLRSLTPAIIKHGLATEQELDLDTYGQRMVQEFREIRAILISPPFVGAWARKPG
jgi:hypothetical protein